MLALLMLPLGAVAYIVALVSLMYALGWPNQDFVFFLTGLITSVLVGLYWVLLWRRTVRWTRRRVAGTVLAVFGALASALLLGLLVRVVAPGPLSVFVGTLGGLFLWLTATIFIWSESTQERIDRLRGAGIESVVCPSCGYNMTGLRVTTCPECGARFTVEELMAATLDARQPVEEMA